MQKRTLILIGLLVLLLLLIYLPDLIPEDRGYPSTLGEIDTAAVTRIEVIASDEQLVLLKEGGELVMSEPFSLPLEDYQRRRLLGALANLKVSALITENPERFTEFALTDTLGIRVKVTTSEQLAADFLVGIESKDFIHSYARLVGSQQILQMTQNLTSTFKAKAATLFNRELFKLPPEEIQLVSVRDFEDENGSYSLNIDGGNQYTDHRGNTTTADSALVERYLGQASQLRAATVLLPEEERDAQLDHQILAVDLKAYAEQVKLEFYRDPDNEQQRILVLDKYPYRFRVAAHQLDKYRQTRADFLSEEE